MTKINNDAVPHEAEDDDLLVFGPARAKFRELIIERIIAFEEFRKSAERPDGISEALTEIAGLAHKISGVGATLGFQLAGTMARDVERTVLEGRARQIDPATIWSDVEPRLEMLLDALEAILDE